VARVFMLHRAEDASAVPGPGFVTEGVEWADGSVAVHRRGRHASTVLWPSIASVLESHGHDGRTQIVWDDERHARDKGEIMAKWSDELRKILADAEDARQAVEDAVEDVASEVSERVRTGTSRIEDAARRMLDALKNDPDDVSDPPV
jgi:gas vesicle protein